MGTSDTPSNYSPPQSSSVQTDQDHGSFLRDFVLVVGGFTALTLFALGALLYASMFTGTVIERTARVMLASISWFGTLTTLALTHLAGIWIGEPGYS